MTGAKLVHAECNCKYQGQQKPGQKTEARNGVTQKERSTLIGPNALFRKCYYIIVMPPNCMISHWSSLTGNLFLQYEYKK